MTLATDKMRILGKTKNPVTGEFSSTVRQPVAPPKPKLKLKISKKRNK
jgi:hypothetical protein